MLVAHGCYLFHGHESDDETDPGSADDAFIPLPLTDAGPAPFPDAAGTPLPPVTGGPPIPSDEPDVGAGDRPSEDPGADEWRDPPPVDADSCCEVGVIVGLDDIDRQASVPVVAWNGAGWGVSFSDTPAPPDWSGPERRTLFGRIDEIGHAVGPPRVLGGFDAFPTDLAWGNNRYALLTTGPRLSDGPALLAILDSEGEARQVTSIPESNGGAAVERYPLIHGWAVATYFDTDGGESGLSRLVLFDDSLNRLPAEQDLGITLHADWRSISVVPSKRRLSVVHATENGILHRAFDGVDLTEDTAARALVWPGTYDVEGPRREEPPPQRVASAVSATRLRDAVIVAFMNRRDVATVVIDPFGEEPPTAPVPVAQSPSHRNPGIAGDDITGTAGICFPSGAGPLGGGAPDADQLRFAAVGPDGQPVGEPVTIISDLSYVAACDVAAAGPGEWFVVWWNAAREEPRHSISGARVTLRGR